MPLGWRKQLDEAWESLQAPASQPGQEFAAVHWSMAITPPLPADMPPRGIVRVYAYATGFDVAGGLVDGVRVAAPWAEVQHLFGKPQAIALRVLRNMIEPIGIQGVRPVGPEELRSSSDQDSWAGWLRAGTSGRAAAAAHRAYQHWRADNGVIAAALKPELPEFFAWLESMEPD